LPGILFLRRSLTWSNIAIVTSSSDEKLLKAQELGATHTVNYNTTPEWADEVLNLTQGKGADIIVETGGPETMPQSVRAVAEGGVISAVGVLTGMTEEKPQLAIGLSLINRNAVLKGINIGPRDRVEEMMRLYQQEDIHPIINRCFKFDGAKDALTYMKDGFHFGKVVIKVNED
jgi:NADPH:quinone reductase-like Zn-dependent oxidoreductase